MAYLVPTILKDLIKKEKYFLSFYYVTKNIFLELV